MAKFLTLIVLLVCNSAFGQKYMIVGKDTLPYKNKMVITFDTTHDGKLINVKSDTSYEEPCYVFEKAGRRIVNRTDTGCLKQGLWIFKDSAGNYSTSVYTNGDDGGLSKYYSKTGKLLKETEEVNLGKNNYIVKEIDYSKGQSITIVNVPFFGFYINNFFIIVPFLTLLMIVRILLNNNIYNIENQTNFPGFGNRFKFELNEPGELRHRLLCVFTVWFFKYKQENRYKIIVSNLLSLFCFGSIAIYTIGPLLCR